MIKRQIKKIFRSLGYDLVRFSNNDISQNLFNLYKNDVYQYPQLILHSWQYGINDTEARKRAHDFVRSFLKRYDIPVLKTGESIPKDIWIYWDQGWDSAPPIVKACRKQLENVDQDFVYHFLDSKSLKEKLQLPEQIKNNLKDNITTYSDIVRCALLSEYGGIWMDATCYLTQPLNRLIIENKNRYFSFTRADKLANPWFMAAPRGHIIPTLLRDVQVAWWLNTSELPAYYWIIYLFEALSNEMPSFHDAWQERLFISGRHLSLAYVMDAPYDSKLMQIITEYNYVQKLSYKTNWAKNPIPGSFASYIIN